MLIFYDKRIPDKAKIRLNEFGDAVPFETKGIVYDSISGHPDVFLCRINDQIIVAPNLPNIYKKLLEDNKIPFIEGEESVGHKYPDTAKYNIVTTDKFLMHNFRYTDSKILQHEGDLDLIHLNQGYSRCNLLPLKENHFITSDEGIHRTLEKFQINSLYVQPEGILLEGHKHGFFGGTCGVHKNKVFFIGSLDNFQDGNKVKVFLEQLNYEIIELYDGPLFDGGSLFFV